jgi:hypothetical protein
VIVYLVKQKFLQPARGNRVLKSPYLWGASMPDDVDKFLAEEQQLESCREDLIKEVLKQREAANKAFDEKLARLGYNEDHAPRRSHHKKSAETSRQL